MKLNKVEQKNYSNAIRMCWDKDPKIQTYSRNSAFDLDERVRLEVKCLENNSDLKFYEVYNNNDMVGYFGKEEQPFPCLTTFFIMPKYREVKNEIWNYMISHLPEKFFIGLFKVNKRAINFCINQGAKQIAELQMEDKPAVLLQIGSN